MATRDRVPDALKEQWASIRETTIELAVSRQTVHELIASKQLDTRKYFGNRTLVSRDSIKALLATFTDGAAR
jgi:hypothetical protein